MSIRLLVTNPDEVQELITIAHVSGGYFDKSRVLWDEREDGPFPKDMLPYVGGLARKDNQLVIDQAKLDAHLTWVKETTAQKESYEKECKERMDRIKNTNPATATDEELRAIVGDLLQCVNGGAPLMLAVPPMRRSRINWKILAAGGAVGAAALGTYLAF